MGSTFLTFEAGDVSEGICYLMTVSKWQSESISLIVKFNFSKFHFSCAATPGRIES